MTFDPSNALRCGQGFYSPNLVAIGHSWTIWPLDDLWPVGLRRKVDSSPQLAKPYPRAKFQLRRSKHGRTHSDTDRQTDRQTDRHGKFINIEGNANFDIHSKFQDHTINKVFKMATFDFLRWQPPPPPPSLTAYLTVLPPPSYQTNMLGIFLNSILTMKFKVKGYIWG